MGVHTAPKYSQWPIVCSTFINHRSVKTGSRRHTSLRIFTSHKSILRRESIRQRTAYIIRSRTVNSPTQSSNRQQNERVEDRSLEGDHVKELAGSSIDRRNCWTLKRPTSSGEHSVLKGRERRRKKERKGMKGSRGLMPLSRKGKYRVCKQLVPA
jgi:hypothetical protein